MATSHFWTNGPEAYDAGLRDECDSQIQALRDRLKSAGSPAQSLLIEAEISQLESQLREQLRRINRALF